MTRRIHIAGAALCAAAALAGCHARQRQPAKQDEARPATGIQETTRPVAPAEPALVSAMPGTPPAGADAQPAVTGADEPVTSQMGSGLLYGSTGAAPEAPVAPRQSEPTVAPTTTAAPIARRGGIGAGQVCAAAIAMIMGRDPATIQVVSEGALTTRVRYVREDGETWTNDCMVGANYVVWRAVSGDSLGRWREEDQITYSADERGLAITVDGETRAFLPPQ